MPEIEDEKNQALSKYINGQRNQSKNYFAFSAEWIGITLTILTLLWSFNKIIPAVSYMLLVAFVCFINTVAVNSKIIHEIDEGQFTSIEDINPWVGFAENSYGLASTLVLTSFMIIFYAAMGEDIIAPTFFILVTWIMIGIYASIRKKVNRKKVETVIVKMKKKTISMKIFLYLIEIVFLVLLWIDYLDVYDWISALF
jgi:hypothetical protein